MEILSSCAVVSVPMDRVADFSIVIPCRNERSRLPATLVSLRNFFDAFSLVGEAIVVVEKGDDGTEVLAAEAAEADPRIRVVANPVARGKGYAVKTGMQAAQGGVQFFMDVDLSVPLDFVPRFLAETSRGAEVVIGSRRHPQSVIVRSQPLRRVLAGRAFNWCLRLCRATPFKDTQCGFKAFTQTAAQAVFSHLSVDGFGFDVEALALAGRYGFRIVELPVEWTDGAGSKVQPLSDGLRAFFDATRAARRIRRLPARDFQLSNPS